MYILGIWDGHDSGAALIRENRIIYAANEERFTKRKLEVRFPYRSIRASLEFERIKPGDVKVIAFPTLEFTKTVSRVFPAQKEAYYKFRRRKMLKPRFEEQRHYLKYAMTSIGVLPLCGAISRHSVGSSLRAMGFSDFKLYAVDHHRAHAATAAFTSGFRDSLVVTLDGLGDGKSGTVSAFENGALKQISSIPSRDSIGVFYEQVTNILGMRELEDEGKIMAMADFSYPFKYSENKLKGFFAVEGTGIKARYGPIAQYKMLSRISWSTPREQFAYMAQQVLEETLQKYFENLSKEHKFDSVAVSGGTMSNVKANMRIREKGLFKRHYIFPHMGDGGIALGAAMQVNYELNGISAYAFNDAYLGNDYGDNEIEETLKKDAALHFELDGDKPGHAADLISDNNYLFWFQDRMEYGPRALGNRSIVAKAGSDDVKDRLNLYVKKREWFQPFAPSMLAEDAHMLLDGATEHNKFMTMAYRVREQHRDIMKSVVHVDMTSRPQMVGDENRAYMEMLKRVRKRSGYGVVLNTSLNIHGMPIAMTPEDVIRAAKETGTRYMFLGSYFVENTKATS